MADSAAMLVDDLRPYQPVRHWVLSVPFLPRFPITQTRRIFRVWNSCKTNSRVCPGTEGFTALGNDCEEPSSAIEPADMVCVTQTAGKGVCVPLSEKVNKKKQTFRSRRPGNLHMVVRALCGLVQSNNRVAVNENGIIPCRMVWIDRE
jgi:hypothetical protein